MADPPINGSFAKSSARHTALYGLLEALGVEPVLGEVMSNRDDTSLMIVASWKAYVQRCSRGSLPAELMGVSMLSSDSEAGSAFDRLRSHRPSPPCGSQPCKDAVLEQACSLP